MYVVTFSTPCRWKQKVVSAIISSTKYISTNQIIHVIKEFEADENVCSLLLCLTQPLK